MVIIVPEKLSSISPNKITFIYLSIVSVLLIGLNFHYLLTMKIYGTSEESVERFCNGKPAYLHFHSNIWPWLDTMTASVIPFALILTANIAMTYKVIQLYTLLCITSVSLNRYKLKSIRKYIVCIKKTVAIIIFFTRLRTYIFYRIQLFPNITRLII